MEVGSSVSPGGGADVEIQHKIDLKAPATTSKMRIFVPTGANPPRFREIEVYNFVLPPEAPVVTVVKGDVSGDGKLGIPDATIALQIAVGKITATADQLKAGDVNGNGKIDIADVTQILRAAVGLSKL
ncbi:MAG: dockerin type I repeat-containing protein [Armatimonadota bacterium]